MDSSLSSREKRKISRRVAARVSFIGKLSEFGGLYKVKSAGEVLGVSRQTVNNHIKTGKLIAIKQGNDYLIPGFQFSEEGKIPHLEEILKILGDASPEAKCTFFLNPIKMKDGTESLPYEVLKEGAEYEDLRIIKRDAKLFLTNAAS